MTFKRMRACVPSYPNLGHFTKKKIKYFVVFYFVKRLSIGRSFTHIERFIVPGEWTAWRSCVAICNLPIDDQNAPIARKERLTRGKTQRRTDYIS